MERGRHIHTYKTNAEFEEAYNGSYYHEPWVSYTASEERVDYNKEHPEREPLTFTCVESGTLKWGQFYHVNSGTSLTNIAIQYSKNGGEWTDVTTGSPVAPGTLVSNAAVICDMAPGDVVQFRGLSESSWSHSGGTFMDSTGLYKLSGNVMSLVHPETFAESLDTPSFEDSMAHLFQGRTWGTREISKYGGYVSDASELLLPATGLTTGCYKEMFKDAVLMYFGPKLLPATTLAMNCYRAMFYYTATSQPDPSAPNPKLLFGPDMPFSVVAQSALTLTYAHNPNLRAVSLPAAYLAGGVGGTGVYNRTLEYCTGLGYMKLLASGSLFHGAMAGIGGSEVALLCYDGDAWQDGATAAAQYRAASNTTAQGWVPFECRSRGYSTCGIPNDGTLTIPQAVKDAIMAGYRAGGDMTEFGNLINSMALDGRTIEYGNIV